MTDKEKAEKLAAAAPKLSAKNIDAINDIYPAYIFRRRKTGEIWTTCCGRYEKVPKQGRGDKLTAIMEAEHRSEPKLFRYCHAAYAPPPKVYKTTYCPYCGKEVQVKELGRTGSRKNLAAYRRVVVMRQHRGALWATAYYTSKKYGDVCRLTAKPNCVLAKVYRFKHGEATNAYGRYWSEMEWTGISNLTERPKKLPFKFYEPFGYDNNEGMGYTVIAADEVKKSAFRYCGFDEFTERSHLAMRFLAVCCLYPRQVEMLMKAGLFGAVEDLTEGKKWNAAAFNWNEPDPLKSFDLNKNEMKEFLAGKKDLDNLAIYKQFRRLKIKCTTANIEWIKEKSPHGKEKTVFKMLKKYRIEPARWIPYIKERAEKEVKGRRTYKSARDTIQLWVDYIDAAEVIGYDLKNPIMLMPKQIKRKHDQATEAALPVRAARRAEQLSEKEKVRREELTKKYAFETEKYLIRAPIDATEIAEEGKALKHCVGGYADRHISGKLAILFLRDVKEPHKPLVTIEMNGTRMVQIHGYLNDCKKKMKPQEQYAEILDQWLEWVKAGSKRDKNGEPKMPRKKKEVTAA